MTHDTSQTTLVLGGGPAGLTAGYLLGQANRNALVFEADDQVGGIAKTVERDGYRFDLGGHRFFTKSIEVDTLWHEVLGDEFLLRPRMSRIYWNNRYLDYPLRGPDVIRKLGPVELARCMASYARAAARRNKVDDSLEDWVSNRFGRRLFELFFKSYTEKVWGVPTTEIRAEWAAQRIKGLSFFSAAKAAFFGNKDNKVKSLISEFNYPRFGPGQMWEAMRGAIEEQGGEVRLDVARRRAWSSRAAGSPASSSAARPSRARTRSSPRLPLREVVRDDQPCRAAGGDRCRSRTSLPRLPHRRARRRRRGSVPGQLDLHPRAGRARRAHSELPLLVAVDGPRPGQGVRRARVLLLRGRRPVDDGRRRARERSPRTSSSSSGSLPQSKVERGFAIRVPKAYPIYDADYAERVETIRGWLDGIENLQQVGRNGLHRYNNSDHSMLTAMRAVDNLLTGAHHDIWAVNAESVYHETDVADEHPYRAAPETPEMQVLATSHTE